MTPAISSADAGLTGTVGQLDVIDISGYSADRTYTLPGTAAAGDVCGVSLSTGDATYELLITATAGDTLNGIAGGTEWSRIFITGEIVTFICTVANTTWLVLEDGRIPMHAHMRLTTITDLTQAAATHWLPTDQGGAWTVNGTDVGGISDVATSKMTIRRAAIVDVSASMRAAANSSALGGFTISLNGTTPTREAFSYNTTSTGYGSRGIGYTVKYAAGDTLQFMGYHSAANQGMGDFPTYASGHFSVTEVL